MAKKNYFSRIVPNFTELVADCSESEGTSDQETDDSGDEDSTATKIIKTPKSLGTFV